MVKPLSTPKDSNGDLAIFSVMHQVYFPGCPKVALSISPDLEPVAFMRVSLIARPIVAFARWPGPKTLVMPLTPMLSASGPLITAKTAAPIVLAVMA